MHSYSIKKLNLSLDLIHEIVNFLPFDIKWADSRVSFIFDFFIFKNQYHFILFNKTVKKIRDLLNQKKEEFEQFSVNLGRLSVARLTAINKKTNITFHNCKSICEIILGYNMVFLPQFNQYDLVWPDLYYPGADNVNLRVRVARKFKILEGWCELGWNMLENIVMDQSDINEVRVILETVDRYTRSISNIMRGLE